MRMMLARRFFGAAGAVGVGVVALGVAPLEDGRGAGGGEAGELAQGVVEGGEEHGLFHLATRAVGLRERLGD